MNRPGPALRLTGALFAALFLFSAAVQYNDPDPIPWLAVYGLAAVAGARAALGRRDLALPASTGTWALAWAGALVPEVLEVLGSSPSLTGLTTYRMMDVGVEVTREMLGLVMVAVAMAVLGLAHLRVFFGSSR